MPSSPRSEPDTNPAIHYETLLAEGVTAQREFERQAETDDLGLDAKYAARSDELLRERVALLRRLEQLKTLADLFPRLASVRERDAAEVEGAFDASEPDELDPDELDEFVAVLERLALASGYEVHGLGHESIDLKRNGVEISLQLQPFPTAHGLLGSRITAMSVEWTSSSRVRSIQYAEGDWDTRCLNPAVQREIDRVVAIFG